MAGKTRLASGGRMMGSPRWSCPVQKRDKKQDMGILCSKAKGRGVCTDRRASPRWSFWRLDSNERWTVGEINKIVLSEGRKGGESKQSRRLAGRDDFEPVAVA